MYQQKNTTELRVCVCCHSRMSKMGTYKVSFVLSFFITLAAAVPFTMGTKINRLATISTTGLIQKHGYPAEEHSVTTEDGYILKLHRIPFSPKCPAGPNKPPVLLMHGLLTSSSDWVIRGAENGFGFILADLGYDVWIGNSRGNTYSKKHVTLDPNENNGLFWNFSWHEMGMYDIPAEIDYILELTGQPKLFYIGHSQGTTQFFVMASERPEYNDKIRAMFSFAPVAYMSNAEGPLLRFYHSQNTVDKLEKSVGAQAILPHSFIYTVLGQILCSDGSPTQFLCEYFVNLICGFDPEQLDASVIPLLVGYAPAGASFKQLIHYAQAIVSGKFRRYDYGRQGNLDLYGTETPPDYDLGKITAPVSLHYSSNDWLASTVDVNQLYEELSNPIGKFLVPHPTFNHIDFQLAIDVKTLLYNSVTDLMSKY